MGKLASVFSKHPVVVSRWVREGSRLKEEDPEFSTALEKLDKALSEEVLDRLRTNRSPTRNRTTKREKKPTGGQ